MDDQYGKAWEFITIIKHPYKIDYENIEKAHKKRGQFDRRRPYRNIFWTGVS